MRPLLFIALAFASTAAPMPAQSRCDYTAERNADLPASGLRQLRIEARAGSLRIVGRDGLDRIRVRGIACAENREDLDDIRLDARTESGEAVVIVEIPDRENWDGQRRLDLEIEVPRGLALDVLDSSGEIEIERVGALRLKDSSGDIRVLGAAGDVDVEDSSGGIDLSDVGGQVTISDSSGDIELGGIRGAVTIDRDSSGGIDIRGAASVLVRRDSSGDIDVADVRGDLVVERDGSGSIRARNVAGNVRIPSDKRIR